MCEYFATLNTQVRYSVDLTLLRSSGYTVAWVCQSRAPQCALSASGCVSWARVQSPGMARTRGETAGGGDGTGEAPEGGGDALVCSSCVTFRFPVSSSPVLVNLPPPATPPTPSTPTTPSTPSTPPTPSRRDPNITSIGAIGRGGAGCGPGKAADQGAIGHAILTDARVPEPDGPGEQQRVDGVHFGVLAVAPRVGAVAQIAHVAIRRPEVVLGGRDPRRPEHPRVVRRGPVVKPVVRARPRIVNGNTVPQS